MKIVRALFGIALLAAAPPKPPAGDVDLGRVGWREQGIVVCAGSLGEIEGVSRDTLEATCGCAVDRFMEARRGETLPAVGLEPFRQGVRGELLACVAEQRPAVAAAFARRLAETAAAAAPAPLSSDEAKPTGTSEPAPGDSPGRSGGDLRSALDDLSLPAWLTDSGLPSWAWVILAAFAFLLLRGLFRRDDRRDLLGPPPSTRFGPRPSPPMPRRPDPPRQS